MRRPRSASLRVAAVTLGLALAGGACKGPDPREQFEIQDLETYWAVDSPRSGTVYIAPVLRFRLKNRSARNARSVEAQAGFRRVGAEDKEWASGFVIVATGKAPLAAGASTLVEIKSEGRYSMFDTAPEDMLKNEAFQDAKATLYVRSGNSSWTPLLEGLLVERRIGSKSTVIPTVPVAPQP
jgi:hypothetical protein